MNPSKLRELAMAAPTVVFDNETESGRFYNAASPDVIISLLDKLDAAREALEHYATLGIHEPWKAQEALERMGEK